MRCSKARTLIPLSLDDTSAPREQSALSEHLRSCPACAAYSSEVARASALLDADAYTVDAAADLSPAFASRLHSALLSEAHPQRAALSVILQRLFDRVFAPYAPPHVRAVRAIAVFAAIWLSISYLSAPLFAPAARTLPCRFGHLATFRVRTSSDRRVYASLSQRRTLDRATAREVNVR